MATRCCMPPESCHGYRSMNRTSPTAPSASSTSESRSRRLSFLCRSGSSTLFRTDIQGISERLYSWKTSAIRSGGPGHRGAAQDDLAGRRAAAGRRCT